MLVQSSDHTGLNYRVDKMSFSRQVKYLAAQNTFLTRAYELLEKIGVQEQSMAGIPVMH